MADWREWLGKVENKRSEAESSDDLAHWAMTEANLLIRGFTLMAEAVEAVEGGVGKVCADCGEIGECADWCSVRKALEWLRGVGK